MILYCQNPTSLPNSNNSTKQKQKKNKNPRKREGEQSILGKGSQIGRKLNKRDPEEINKDEGLLLELKSGARWSLGDYSFQKNPDSGVSKVQGGAKS